jgi:hypothetical protein
MYSRGTINTPMVRKFEEAGDDLKPARMPLEREGNPGGKSWSLSLGYLVTLRHTLLGRCR